MKIEHTEITVKKIMKNLYVATTNITSPIRAEVNMKGRSEEIARQKLLLSIENKPYKHLDNL